MRWSLRYPPLVVAALVAAFAAGLPAPAFADPGERVALIIGNSTYASGSSLSALPNAVGDGHLVRDRLKSLGFLDDDILLVENVKRQQFIDAITRFKAKARNARTVIVFYSGHGKEDIEGHPYLLPTDTADSDSSMVQGYGVALNFLIQAFPAQGRGAVRVFLIDACRSRDAVKGDSFGLSPGSLADGVFVQTSTRSGIEASDGPVGGHSPFASAIENVLSRADVKTMSVKAIFDGVEGETMKNSRGAQDPELTTQSSLASSISILGDLLGTQSDQLFSSSDVSSDSERKVWNIVTNLDSVRGYKLYLEQYPAAAHSMDARSRAAVLARNFAVSAASTVADPANEAREAMSALTATDWNILDDRSLFTKAVSRAPLDSIQRLGNAGDRKAATVAAIGYRLGLGGAKTDYAVAERLFRAAALAGEPYAQCDLGEMLLRGEGIKADPTQGARFIGDAVRGGNDGCKTDLGILYFQGKVLKKDTRRAVGLVTEAADAGYADAQYLLSVIYLGGLSDAPRDLQRSYDYLTKAAAQNQSLAQGALAETLYYGAPEIGVEKDEQQALNLAKLSAGQQDPSGQYVLGAFNLYGLAGLRQDQTEGVRLLRLSADAGHIKAMISLSDVYAEGLGLPKDNTKAFELIQKAAKTGDWYARIQLANVYRDGLLNQPGQPAEAAKVLQAVANEGSGEAYYLLWDLQSVGIPGLPADLKAADANLKKAVDLDWPLARIDFAAFHYGDTRSADYAPAKALEAFRKYADLKIPKAQYYLGETYINGELGLSADMAAGAALIKEIADKHFGPAELALYKLYRSGWSGTPANDVEALRYLKAAVQDGVASAQSELAWCYHDGSLGLSKDNAEGLRLLRSSEEHGSGDAAISLGLANEFADFGLPMNTSEAARHYKLAVARGNHEAEFRLSGLYSVGADGVARNEPEAARLLRQAADGGYLPAQTWLANDLLAGTNGTKKNLGDGMRRLRLASDGGNAQAQYDLSLAYKYGSFGVQANPKESSRLLTAARQRGGYYEHDGTQQVVFVKPVVVTP